VTSLLLSPDGSGPLYGQIYRALRNSILSGRLPAGAQLPPSRALAQELGTSRNVVVIAFEQLVSEGYAQARVGSGTFVAATLPDFAHDSPVAFPCSNPDGGTPTLAPLAHQAGDPYRTEVPPALRLSRFGRAALDQLGGDGRLDIDPSPPRFDFRYGRVAPDARGMSDWHRLLAREARRVDLDYGAAAGEPGLRAAIAGYLRRSRGVRCTADQVVVVSGSQQALDLVARVMVDPGQTVLIEEPQYRGARQVFLASGARLLPVPVDEDGLDLGAAKCVDARLAYVTPSHQFPTGAVMSLSRRLALLEWARKHDGYVIEDDYDSEFRYQGRPIEAVQGLDRYHRTIYIGTFSKVLSPALRIGYMVLPEHLVEVFQAAKWINDRHTPRLEQMVAAAFIEQGYFEQHLRRMRQVNALRRAAVLRAIEHHLGTAVDVVGTNAGLHLLLWLRGLGREDLAQLQARARALDVGIYPVSELYLVPPDRAGLLIGYASLDEIAIERGIALLGQALSATAVG
jgi:GntR family transcriptional regulator/MocR family aminotransferase